MTTSLSAEPFWFVHVPVDGILYVFGRRSDGHGNWFGSPGSCRGSMTETVGAAWGSAATCSSKVDGRDGGCLLSIALARNLWIEYNSVTDFSVHKW